MSPAKKKKRLMDRARRSLFSALSDASDRRECGTYACNAWTERPPAICYCEGVELAAVAYVDLLNADVYLMPDTDIYHGELVDALVEHGWEIIPAEGGSP